MGLQIPESDIKAAYEAAQAVAAKEGRGRSHELAETLADAATDAVVWATQNCDLSRLGDGGFASFAASAVRKFIRRAMAAAIRRAKHDVRSIDVEGAPELEASAVTPDRPLLIEDLPEELAYLVRLIFIDGYTFEDAALLCGASKAAVHRRLRKAAKLLAVGRLIPIRPAGERRLGRVKFEKAN